VPTTLSTLDAAKLKLALSKKVEESKARLKSRHAEAVEFFNQHHLEPGQIRQHAARVGAAGALAGAVLFSGPLAQEIGNTPHAAVASASTSELQKELSQLLSKILTGKPEPISPAIEQAISQAITGVWGIKASAVLNGEKLNQSYGYIGAEQHLPRFPGDSIGEHDEYQRSGITPGRGAWGYFADSRDSLTQDLKIKEKYYVAVQTLYLPDWQARLPYLREWYKYRKVVVVNPGNGRTIICDVADSGPADWTGKHFGGSPEVMAYLGLNVGPQKGAVILFFVDDPEGEIPLGPVEYNVVTGRTKMAVK